MKTIMIIKILMKKNKTRRFILVKDLLFQFCLQFGCKQQDDNNDNNDNKHNICLKSMNKSLQIPVYGQRIVQSKVLIISRAISNYRLNRRISIRPSSRESTHFLLMFIPYKGGGVFQYKDGWEGVGQYRFVRGQGVIQPIKYSRMKCGVQVWKVIFQHSIFCPIPKI